MAFSSSFDSTDAFNIQFKDARIGSTPKKPKSATARCQVEGCELDLSGAKAYYSRHKVCAMHSKAPKVIVTGLEQRFCQQCSRFHLLPEFDLGKRSCRRRLAGHNQRRRKPQPRSIFSSRCARFASSIFGPSSGGSSRNNNGGVILNSMSEYGSYPHGLETSSRHEPSSCSSDCALSPLSNQPLTATWRNRVSAFGINSLFISDEGQPAVSVGRFDEDVFPLGAFCEDSQSQVGNEREFSVGMMPFMESQRQWSLF